MKWLLRIYAYIKLNIQVNELTTCTHMYACAWTYTSLADEHAVAKSDEDGNENYTQRVWQIHKAFSQSHANMCLHPYKYTFCTHTHTYMHTYN